MPSKLFFQVYRLLCLYIDCRGSERYENWILFVKTTHVVAHRLVVYHNMHYFTVYPQLTCTSVQRWNNAAFEVADRGDVGEDVVCVDWPMRISSIDRWVIHTQQVTCTPAFAAWINLYSSWPNCEHGRLLWPSLEMIGGGQVYTTKIDEINMIGWFFIYAQWNPIRRAHWFS